MFESLSDKLKRTLKNLRGEGVLTKEHVDAALREIRLALLEADVNFKVAKDFIASVKEKAEGQQVWQELKPSEQVVKIVFDELVDLLGGQSSRLVFTRQTPNVVMLVGLQGSGKTTSTGKIARWLAQNQDRKPLLLSVDVYRPAAREQLKVIAKATGQQIFEQTETDDPLTLVRSAMKHAQQTGFDTLLIDTAGRLHIDEALMEELVNIKSETHPVEILFVADAMTGQDAVRSAEEFHRRIGITGVVLTKMDGDARGGAALSIKQVTGQPVKFVGVGEKYDALEPFYPDRVAQRILGMGDVLSLIEEVQSKVDQSEAEEQLRKLQKNEFTLDDFRSQLRQVKKLGSFSKIMKLLPDQLLGGIGMPQMDEEQTKEMEKELKRTESIIDSMTHEERTDHKILNANRRRRIARGSGTSVSEVNKLIKQYTEMRQMMRQLSGSGMFGGSGLKGKMMRRLTGMSDMAGMGGNGDELPALPSIPALGGSGKKKNKKKRKKSEDNYGGKDLLAIKLMRTGAKKQPSYRIVVKEKQSKRDGAYLENLGTYNPTREPAEVKLKMDRVRYWIGKGAQPTDTVSRLIKVGGKQEGGATRSVSFAANLPMRAAIEMVVKALVDDVDAVDVREVDHQGSTLIEVRVAPGDMGKIIGRQGRTVNALRSLAHAGGLKNRQRYLLEIVE